jgi:hypothetical protein
MFGQAVRAETRVLGSWKEIASYLGKGVRTVQRWERHLGLPVRRPNAATRGVVCASPEELDRWIAMRWTRRSVASPLLPLSGRNHAAICANLQISQELRVANQRLVVELMRSAEGVARECEALAVCSGSRSKSSQKR